MSKSTIYRHWTSALPLAIEAYGARVTEAVPVRFSDDVLADLLDQVRRVADLYAGRRGRVIAELLGAGAAMDGGAELVREQFFAQRRAETRRLIQTALDSELWDVEFDPDLVIELLFGPIVFRALNGGEPLTGDDAVVLARVVLRGLAR